MLVQPAFALSGAEATLCPRAPSPLGTESRLVNAIRQPALPPSLGLRVGKGVS